ncbi:MAG TPA: substrate-binding domain-containing protein [Micropepsaceae bacterium]|jgi:molybdate transport system substrate-binding protein|nr:substrate-binding domain-containing protein [Micropepsaceae bacterium]
MKTRILIATLLVSALAAGIAPAQIAAAQQAKGGNVKIYAAAVVKSPLTAIASDYEKASGNKVTVIYDTAGATEQRFRADPEAALLITTVPLIRNAENSGALHDGTSILLGGTVASVAVPPSSKKPDVSTPEKLKAALLAAKRIAVSDPARGATVGTHFMKVIDALGVKDQVLPKVTLANDGIETVRMVLEGKVDLGVSQSSEILQGSPDAMAGPFPKEYSLATDFSLWHRNAMPPAVSDFVALLTGPAGRGKLAAEGVMPPPAR